jgi:hypothetical protein
MNAAEMQMAKNNSRMIDPPLLRVENCRDRAAAP